jgi:hypothetical protein
MDYFSWLAVSTFMTEKENIWLILFAGFVVWFVRTTPSFFNKHNSILVPIIFLQIATDFTTNEKLLQSGGSFSRPGPLFLEAA